MVKDATSKKKEKGIFERLGPAFVVVSVIMAFAIGVLWEKVSSLEKGTPKTSGATPTTTQAQQGQQAKPNVTIDQIKGLFKLDLVKFGDEKRKVLFVDISDPSCPYCHVAAGKNPELNKQIDDSYKKQWVSSNAGKDPEKFKSEWQRFTLVSDGGPYIAPVPEMRKLVEQGKASYVFIYTPGHGNGEMGTRALYCANEKGKYWQVHDLLYTNAGYNLLNNTVKNDKSKAGDLAEFLKSAVSADDMKSCLESDKYDKRLTDDTSVAGSLGIGGTPALFVNATLFGGAYSYKDMESAVTAALK